MLLPVCQIHEMMMTWLRSPAWARDSNVHSSVVFFLLLLLLGWMDYNVLFVDRIDILPFLVVFFLSCRMSLLVVDG